MESRLFLRSDILEGEQGGVGSRSSGIGIAEDMIVIGLLVVTVEAVLRKMLLQRDQCDRNSTEKGREKLDLGPVPILEGEPARC